MAVDLEPKCGVRQGDAGQLLGNGRSETRGGDLAFVARRFGQRCLTCSSSRCPVERQQSRRLVKRSFC